MIKELTLDEIFNGCEDFQGLKSLILEFVEKNNEIISEESSECGADVLNQVMKTMDYLCDISSGKIKTNATLMREFVMNHPLYKRDSTVPEVIFFSNR